MEGQQISIVQVAVLLVATPCAYIPAKLLRWLTLKTQMIMTMTLGFVATCAIPFLLSQGAVARTTVLVAILYGPLIGIYFALIQAIFAEFTPDSMEARCVGMIHMFGNSLRFVPPLM
jgi:MFS-type transporter involved in bile tolerance (Atg22 family)